MPLLQSRQVLRNRTEYCTQEYCDSVPSDKYVCVCVNVHIHTRAHTYIHTYTYKLIIIIKRNTN